MRYTIVRRAIAGAGGDTWGATSWTLYWAFVASLFVDRGLKEGHFRGQEWGQRELPGGATEGRNLQLGLVIAFTSSLSVPWCPGEVDGISCASCSAEARELGDSVSCRDRVRPRTSASA